MKKEIKIEDFKPFACNEQDPRYDIFENGYYSSYSQKFDINMSSTFTKLIQEAGRWCESYASDLLIDIESINDFINKSETGSKRFVLGFRQYGIDHFEFLKNRFENGDRETYRAIWIVDIDKDMESGTIKVHTFRTI